MAFFKFAIMLSFALEVLKHREQRLGIRAIWLLIIDFTSILRSVFVMQHISRYCIRGQRLIRNWICCLFATCSSFTFVTLFIVDSGTQFVGSSRDDSFNDSRFGNRRRILTNMPIVMLWLLLIFKCLHWMAISVGFNLQINDPVGSVKLSPWIVICMEQFPSSCRLEL